MGFLFSLGLNILSNYYLLVFYKGEANLFIKILFTIADPLNFIIKIIIS